MVTSSHERKTQDTHTYQSQQQKSTRGCAQVSPDMNMPLTWKHEEHTQSITLCYTIILYY
jgi:hypothetical protein